MATDCSWEKNTEEQHGFTLVEVLVALVMGVIFFAAIGAMIVDQTQTHEDHQMKVMMQQNGRAALSILTNELLLAGYSPLPRTDGGTGRLATVEIAGIDTLKMTYDSNEDGEIKRTSGTDNSYDEQTIYAFDEENRQLERNNNTNAFLENVEAFRVLYAYDADDLGSGSAKYGVLEEAAPGVTRWAYSSQGTGALDMCYTLDSAGKLPDNAVASGVPSPQPGLDRIRAAKIWLLMRSNKRRNKETLETKLDNIPDFDVGGLDTDHYSYRLYTTTVKLRNMYY